MAYTINARFEGRGASALAARAEGARLRPGSSSVSQAAQALTAPASAGTSPLSASLANLQLSVETASLFALHNQLELAGQDLVDLVKDQERSNQMLKAVREVESLLRKSTTDGHITRREINDLRTLVGDLNARHGVSIDFEAELGVLEGDLFSKASGERVHGGAQDDGDYLWSNELSTTEHHKKNAEQVKNMKAELSDLKDAIKGNVSQNELKLQLANQEYNNARQSVSTMSHRYDEVNRGIIANFA